MESLEWLVVILPLFTALITGIITYFSTRSKILLDLTAEYDKDLRDNRLEVYKKLWVLLEPLARYSPKGKLTYLLIKQASENMRQWYFHTGGIYLSRSTRAPYFDLKREMQKVIDDLALAEKDGERINSERAEIILVKGKTLRESMADDIGTRRGSLT